MIRRRLYNPAQLDPDELKASFIARREILAEMLRLLGEQKPGRPCQHMLLVGSRGMGKTTLGLRFLQAVGETPDLAEVWQPVAFHEESYQIADLADFWLTALHHLTRATADPRWADKAEALAADETDPERLAAYALSALLDFCRAGGKRLILFVENLDLVFKQLSGEREVHALRAALIEHSQILFVGSANAVFEAIQHRGEPFYEFFRLFLLEGLEQDEYIQIFQALAEQEDIKGIPEILDRERGRLETIRRLTGGNPRLLALAYRILIESPFGSAFKDLERLIDEQTPYFKSRIEELPMQARKVFHCLAEGWRPMLAREVSATTRLSSSHTSAQLKQLVNKGYVREVRPEREKRTRYEVGDRFYNIYFLLRFSRRGRRRLELLATFLNDLFGPAPTRSMYLATLEEVIKGTPADEEISDWLGVLSHHVANDSNFAEREDWRNKAVSLIIDSIGENAAAFGETERTFSRRDPPDANLSADNVRRGIEMFSSGSFAEAEAACREAISQEPDGLSTWVLLGYVLVRRERFADAIAVFERVVEAVGPNDTPESRIYAVGALTGKVLTLVALKRPDDALSAIGKISKLLSEYDLHALHHQAAESLRICGNLLAETDQHEKAIAAWRQALEHVRPDDLATSRYLAITLLNSLGSSYLKLKRYEDWIISFNRLSEYVHTNDPVNVRRKFAELLTTGGSFMNTLKRWDDAESNCRKATEIDPGCGEAWRVMAEAILGHDDNARLEEAEQCARRAAGLAPQNPAAFHAVSDVLARRGNCAEALQMLDHALLVGSHSQGWNRHGLTESLINLMAAGYGPQIKQIMKNYPVLAETMEPLWHVVRAETGEKLEPMPAEITDAATDIIRKFGEKRRYLAPKLLADHTPT